MINKKKSPEAASASSTEVERRRKRRSRGRRKSEDNEETKAINLYESNGVYTGDTIYKTDNGSANYVVYHRVNSCKDNDNDGDDDDNDGDDEDVYTINETGALLVAGSEDSGVITNGPLYENLETHRNGQGRVKSEGLELDVNPKMSVGREEGRSDGFAVGRVVGFPGGILPLKPRRLKGRLDGRTELERERKDHREKARREEGERERR